MIQDSGDSNNHDYLRIKEKVDQVAPHLYQSDNQIALSSQFLNEEIVLTFQAADVQFRSSWE